MDLLIDVNIALDVCTGRMPHAEYSAAAMLQCTNNRGKLWLYVGSVQTLEYNLFSELKRHASAVTPPTNIQIMRHTKALLRTFATDKHWLAALAEEGSVFDSEDPEDEQLIRALGRFTPGTVRLLTRDKKLLENHPDLAIAPLQYLQMPAEKRRSTSPTSKPSKTRFAPRSSATSIECSTTANTSWAQKSNNSKTASPNTSASNTA